MKGIVTSVYSSLKKPLFKLNYKKNDGLIYWREKILYSFAFLGLYFGFIVLIPSLIASFKNDVVFIAIVDILVYIYLVFIFTSNRVSFRFRVNNLLVIIYLLSVILLLVLGPYGAGIIWLFTVPLIAGILFGLKPAIHAVIVNLLTLVIIGFIIHSDPSASLLITAYGLDGYIAVSINFLALNTLFSISLGVLLDGLNKTMSEEQNLRKMLKDERDTMKVLKEKAEASDKIKTSFLTNISHDLRTPLNAILGFTQLMSAKQLNPNTLQKYYSIIMSQGQSLLNLINDIIDIAKLEADEITISKEHFQLPVLLHEVVQFFKQQIQLRKQHDVEIKLIMHDHIPDVIYQDPGRLRQILLNLVGNAVKFTSSGSILLEVKMYDFQSLLFSVQDTGIGIPKDKLDIIFERFRQVDESHTKNYGGAGLGLSICKSLVELLGGYILVESEVNKGTTFYFKIPVI